MDGLTEGETDVLGLIEALSDGASSSTAILDHTADVIVPIFR